MSDTPDEIEKTYGVILQPEAVDGIESGYRYLTARSPEAAGRWLNGIMEAVYSLEHLPRRCPLAHENDYFPEEIRVLLYGDRHRAYRILFTLVEETVSVLYVRHSAQDTVKPEPEEE